MLCAIMVLYDRLLMHQRRSTRTLIRDCSAQWAELFVNHHFNQPGRPISLVGSASPSVAINISFDRISWLLEES